MPPTRKPDEHEQRSMSMTAGSAMLGVDRYTRYRSGSMMDLWEAGLERVVFSRYQGIKKRRREDRERGRSSKKKKKTKTKDTDDQGRDRQISTIDNLCKWPSGMQAALLLRRDKQRTRGGKVVNFRELPSNFATRLIPPLPRYPPRSYVNGVSIKSWR